MRRLVTATSLRVLATWIMFLLGVKATVSGGAANCPRVCFCNAPSRIVYCSRRGLTAIPDGIPTDSLQINLNGNTFLSPVVRRSNLSLFISLEHLYLSECGLESLEVGAFADLIGLRWLDLSNNRLRTIEPDTFHGLHLQHLFLNGNRNIQLLPDSFAGLVTTGLYLHDCSLPTVDPDVLEPLNTTLRYLWLNGNELERLDSRLTASFSRLLHLRLGSNPLRCGCDSVWLKEFFDKHVDAFRGALPPSCLSPSRLRGKLFSDLTARDLHCRPPMFTSLEAHFDRHVVSWTGSAAAAAAAPADMLPASTQLRCSAVGDPVPTLYWIQPNGKTTKYERRTTNNDVNDDVEENVAVLDLLENVPIDPSSIAGTYICVANNDAGNVTLTVNVPSNRPPPSARRIPTTADGIRRTTAQVPPRALPRLPPSTTSESAGQATVNIQSRLLGDSLLQLQRLSALTPSSSGSDQSVGGEPVYSLIGKHKNRSATHSLEDELLITAVDSRARFTSTEMIVAVVSTHLATVLLCAAALCVCRHQRLMSGGSRHVKGRRRTPVQSSSSSTTGSSGTSRACRALRAAYDRRLHWSSSRHRRDSRESATYDKAVPCDDLSLDRGAAARSSETVSLNYGVMRQYMLHSYTDNIPSSTIR